MFKNFLLYNLLYFLFFFNSSIDGFNAKLNKFNDFYFKNQNLDWGNLSTEGVEIDFKAAVLAERRLKGGYFDEDLLSIIPNDFSQTEREWKRVKDRIAIFIGPISRSSQKESALWENSAKSIDLLLLDAQRLSSSFKKDFQNIAYRTQTILNFGPNDQFIIKSKKSLTNKVNRDVETLKISKKEAVAKIGDALRGTIIVDELSKISLVISEINQYVDHKGGKVVFKNIWAEDRESGYVGIHAKILLPINDTNYQQQERYILTEMQIHMDSIVDGTEMSPKERTHLIYENVRSGSKQIEQSVASKLLFLTAMEDILIKLELKASLGKEEGENSF